MKSLFKSDIIKQSILIKIEIVETLKSGLHFKLMFQQIFFQKKRKKEYNPGLIVYPGFQNQGILCLSLCK